MTLTKLLVRFQTKFGPAALSSLSAEVLTDALSKEIDFRVSIYVFGQDNRQEYVVYYEFPRTWWQHFKMQVFPNWLLKWFPVQYEMHKRTITFNHMALLPKWDHLPPGQEIVMHSYTTDKNIRPK